MPVVILKELTPEKQPLHAAVLKENKIHGSGPDRFVKLKNTYTNDPIIKVKLDMTPNPNWLVLATTKCVYIEFA